MLRCSSNAEASSGPGSAITEGCEVIIFLSRDDIKAATVHEDRKYNCRFGSFNMKDWLGKVFGSKVESVDKKGFVYLLFPTPELWTQALKHRTQILYVADISLITCFLELQPGMTVLESGTGSGSLTHSLARSVAPRGNVCTYEFHAERVSEARKEFEAHKLEEIVSIEHRDIEENGFPERHHGQADAVFLDLPGPWKVRSTSKPKRCSNCRIILVKGLSGHRIISHHEVALVLGQRCLVVESAARCLKPDGRICTFSPCIEQVQKTCGALSRSGFYSIRTMECLLRQFDVKSIQCVTDVWAPSPLSTRQKRKRGVSDKDETEKQPSNAKSYLQIKPASNARGHTGYLTFARKIVDAPSLPEREPPLEVDEVEDSQA